MAISHAVDAHCREGQGDEGEDLEERQGEALARKQGAELFKLVK